MNPEDFDLPDLFEHNAAAQRSTGTVDDDDDPADEQEDENEAPVREKSEFTEAPEEFEKDEQDEKGGDARL